jgi:hypothetical protein
MWSSDNYRGEIKQKKVQVILVVIAECRGVEIRTELPHNESR